jgi:hypothetical protein
VSPISLRGALRRRLPTTTLFLLGSSALLVACGSASTSTSSTPETPTPAFAGGVAASAPAQVTICADLLKLTPADRRSTLDDLRFNSGLQAYTDQALLAACRQHGPASLLAEARRLDAAAQKAERVRAAAKAKARKAQAAASAVKAAANRARYTTADRNSFIGACVATGGTVTVCACSFRQFTEHVPYDQFVRDNQAILDGRMSAADIATRYGAIITRCAGF